MKTAIKPLIRLLSCALALAFLLMALLPAAQAVSYSDRGRYCLYIMTKASPRYEKIATPTDLPEDTYLPTGGTLASGTPVNRGAKVNSELVMVTYYNESGVKVSAIVESSAVGGNYVNMDLGSYGKHPIPKPASVNVAFIADYLRECLGMTVDVEKLAEELESHGIVSEEEEQSHETYVKPGIRVSHKVDVFWQETEEAEPVKITLCELGTVVSTIKIGREEKVVPTGQLSWDTDADSAHRIAFLYAPRTGKVTLHLTSSMSSRVLDKCIGGRCVLVYDYAEDACGIVYNGESGYVTTAALDFPSGSVIGTGYVELSPERKRAGCAPLRASAASGSNRQTLVYPGDRLIILQKDRGWLQVEINGWRGWLMKKDVHVDEADEGAEE